MSETQSQVPGQARFGVAASALAVASFTVGIVAGLVIGFVRGSDAEPANDDGSPVVASVGDDAVTLAQFEARWKALGPSGRAFYENRGGRATLLDEIADELALAREARSRGLDDDPAVAESMRAASNRALARPLLATEVREGAVPESELRAWYDEHGAEVARPLEVELSEILVTSRDGSGPSDNTPDALTARAKAERLRAAAVAGEDFAGLARRESEGITARSGGRLGWGDPSALPEAYRDAASALQPGDTSPVIEVPEGYLVLRATGRREPRTPSFEEQREAILERLVADDQDALTRRYEAFVAGLRSRGGVELHPELLGSTGPSGPSAPSAGAP